VSDPYSGSAFADEFRTAEPSLNVSAVTVLICTYNRAGLLGETLAALQSMSVPADCAVEILIVDNNSTDATERVVGESARTGPLPVVYLRETRQGKSFALNRGLEHARGDILALTDDDVLPSPHWLERIVAAFREHDVSFVFGKVLPRWGADPPAELLTPRAQAIWGPLALVDYGDLAVHYRPDSRGQRLPIGANVAFPRAALVSLGGWRTDLGKVNNTLICGEDEDIFRRLMAGGLYYGYYDPEIVVHHYVPPDRLTREYFRRWFYWLGKTYALMCQDLFPTIDMATVPRVFGVPRFLYRQAFAQAGRWLAAIPRMDRLGLQIEELRTLQFAGLFVESWRQHRRTRTVLARSLSATVASAGSGKPDDRSAVITD
jgi:glycosyltransferase involved in cell wall biosynthesis